MKKHLLKTLLTALVLLVGGVNIAWAATPTLKSSLEVTGYKAKAYYDFTTNTPAVLPTVAANNNLTYRSGYGLHNYGSGPRSASVSIPVSIGDLVVFETYVSNNDASDAVTINVGTLDASLSMATGFICYSNVSAAAESFTFSTPRYWGVRAVLVMEKDADASTADYTIAYKFYNKPVKTVNGNAAVGSSVVSEASFVEGKTKYIRDDNEPESFVIAASGNDFTVQVHQAEKFSYSLVSSLGGTIISGSGYEGDKVTAGYPRYQLKGTALYEAAVTDKEYRKSFTLTENGITIPVAYTWKTENVVFYAEAENIDGLTTSTAGNISARASNALAAVSTEDVTLTTLQPGKYVIHVGIFTSSTSYGTNTVNFGVGNETFAAAFANANLCEVATDEYELFEETAISYLSSSWGNAQFDYMWIEKTGGVVSIPSFDPNTAFVNPSFEYSANSTSSTAAALTNGGTYYGWTLPNLGADYVNISIGDANGCAGQAFGVPTAKDGDFYYYVRRGWNSSTSADATLSTVLSDLPVGHYTLTMAYKGLDSWDSSHKSKGSYLQLSAVASEKELASMQTPAFDAVEGNNAGAGKFAGDANWQSTSLEFDVVEAGDVTLNILHHLVGGVRSDVVIDNLYLTYKSPQEALLEAYNKALALKTPERTKGLEGYNNSLALAEEALASNDLSTCQQALDDLMDAVTGFLQNNLLIEPDYYYIYHPQTGKFLALGNEWGTSAVVADYGVLFHVYTDMDLERFDVIYKFNSLMSLDDSHYLGNDGWVYTDCTDEDNRARNYTIAKSYGGFTMTNTANNHLVYVSLMDDSDKYRVASSAIESKDNADYSDDAQTVWQFLTKDEYDAMIAEREAVQKTAVYTAAGIAEDDDVIVGEPVELTFTTGNKWTTTVFRKYDNQPATNNNGTEMYQTTGSFTQTVTGLASGLYKVSIQGFYRCGSSEHDSNIVLAYLDANGSKVQVKSWATDKGEGNDPNSMGAAKDKFDDGKYVSETYAYVGEDGNLKLTVNNPAFVFGCWFMVNNVKYAAVTLPIDPNALATEDDYTALTNAITAVEEKLGFLSGEYAPYNNIEALQLLAAAKSIDKLSDNLQTDVQNATTALTIAEWNVNDAEVNAIFDGSFEHDYSGQTGNINPIGWQRVKGAAADGYNVRLMNGTNASLAATTSGKALFTKQSAYYGYADGYTMPLKANTIYKISFVYGGWGDCKKDGYVSMTAPDGSAVDVSPADLPVDATNADSDKNSWKPYTALFKTGDAGEYVLGLRKKNYDTSGQSQYVYGDIRIFRATAADFKEQLAAEIAIADDVDVTANVGAAAFQIPASAVTSLSSAISTAQGIYDDADATIDEVLQAVENLKKAEDDYSNAELNAPAANKVYNIVNVTPDYNHAGKAVTFKSSATADLAGNTTSMGWNEKPGSVYPQGVKFTSVEGAKNTYILSYTRADGTDIYVSTGTTSGLGSSTSQIRPTTDAAKALKVRVEASTTDGVWYLWNTEADKRLGANGANDQGLFTGEANGNKYYDMELQEAVNNEYNLVVDATNQYATLIVPFDATVPAGIIVYSLSNANGNELELQPVTEIKANTPYVVYAEDGFTTTLAGLGAAFTENSYTTGWLTGVYAETTVPNGSYVLQNHGGNVAFYVVDTDAAQPKVQANHAYMTIPSGDGARAYYFGGEATAIGALKALTSGDAEIYDVNGRKQVKLQKGVNIIRTKDGRTQKVMVK